jgi:hypothetical protein
MYKQNQTYMYINKHVCITYKYIIGSIMIGMLLLFVLMGAFAGFTSARLYKTFKGIQFFYCCTEENYI